MKGANLHFRGTRTMRLPVRICQWAIVSRGGAVGVDEGIRTNSTFLTKLNNSSNPNWDPSTGPYFATWGDTAAVYTALCERRIDARDGGQ